MITALIKLIRDFRSYRRTLRYYTDPANPFLWTAPKGTRITSVSMSGRKADGSGGTVTVNLNDGAFNVVVARGYQNPDADQSPASSGGLGGSVST